MKRCAILLLLPLFLFGTVLVKGRERSKSANRPHRPFPLVLRVVRQGGHRGLHECREQFKHDIWNCSLDQQVHKRFPIFVKATLPYATRETAFVHAISSAGITHEIILQCRRNRIAGCRCTEPKKGKKRPRGSASWNWGGCSDNIDYGESETRRYVDNLEKGHDARTAFNLHNNEVGRKVVREYLMTECKCHGLSGTCEVKTCWKRLAPFDMVGTELKLKYRQAVRVAFKQKTLKQRVDGAYRPVAREGRKLVYLEPSPDYCVRNLTAGSYGMLGRTCNSEDTPTDRCIDLCNSCNMRHRTVNHYEEARCRCKIHGCCEFRCDKCIKQTSITTCVNR